MALTVAKFAHHDDAKTPRSLPRRYRCRCRDRTARADRRKVFVGGLAPTVTDADLKAYFSAFGTVLDATVLIFRSNEHGGSDGGSVADDHDHHDHHDHHDAPSGEAAVVGGAGASAEAAAVDSVASEVPVKNSEADSGAKADTGAGTADGTASAGASGKDAQAAGTGSEAAADGPGGAAAVPVQVAGRSAG